VNNIMPEAGRHNWADLLKLIDRIRWIAYHHVDGSGVHFGHVGTADQVNVMLARALRADTRVAPVRVEMWLDVDGVSREVHLPLSTARSLAHWLTVAADIAEGPQYAP
jgi:hypothetical protein